LCRASSGGHSSTNAFTDANTDAYTDANTDADASIRQGRLPKKGWQGRRLAAAQK
jgi:hypothetical protein